MTVQEVGGSFLDVVKCRVNALRSLVQMQRGREAR